MLLELNGSATKRDTYEVRRMLASRSVVAVKAFLSADMTGGLLRELSSCVWQPSGIVGRLNSRSKREVLYSNHRSSCTVYEDGFTPRLRQQVRLIEKRIATILDTEVNRLEHWQAVNYAPGESFDFHIDAGPDFSKQKSGNRVKSIILYLQSSEAGGETYFRALNLKIVPLAGKLLIWGNVLPSGLPDYAMIHAGLPVLAGNKTILVTWQRQRIHRSKQ